MGLFNLFGKSKSASPEPVGELEPFDLDTPLIEFTPVDRWTIRDAVTGTAIFGAIGSGKSSGSGASLARAMLAEDFGFLVLTAKPDEREEWERYAAQMGRSKDVKVFSPQNEWRFNFLDYEMRRGGVGGGLTENIVQLFLTVMEIADRGRSNDGGDGFWKDTVKQLLRSTVDLISIARGTVSLKQISDVIKSAPMTLDDAKSEDWWEKSLCGQLIQEGHTKMEAGELDPMRAQDFDVTASYFLNDYAGLNDKTKSGVKISFSAMADPFLRGVLRELFCTTTNIVPEVTYENGSILIIDLPVKEFNELGTASQVLFKYIFQKTVERRNTKQYPRPVALWADEAQLFVSSYDREFQSTSRSARVATVLLSQNISGYYASFGGDKGKAEADSLLANLATKIFHANGDTTTNQFAADLCGRSLQLRGSFGRSNSNDGQGGSQNTNMSEQLDHDVMPSDFMSLRNGGPDHDLCVDSVICKSGGVWKNNGKSWLKTTFRQQ